jgi:preprotein translocase subunit SecA
MLGGNAEFLARAEMRKEFKRQGLEEDVIDNIIGEATGFAETDDEQILKARETFKELFDKFKEEIAPEAAQVCAVGGLFILGTERHESRRIDNQLRGRAGRQGDPGESQFFLSLGDDLMRLFGGERIHNMMEFLNVDEDIPIENRILSRTIENAQKKVEGRNFSARKHVLQFDDVMSQMRTTIYKQRGKVLDDEDISANIREMLEETVRDTVSTFCQGEIADDWNLTGLREHFKSFGLTQDGDFDYGVEELSEVEKSAIEEELYNRAMKRYEEQEVEFTPEIMRSIERDALLLNVDTKWMDHIDHMADLKQGIYLRTMGGGKDPVVEYRHEAFAMYDEMIMSIREDTVRMILTVRKATERKQVMKPTAENAGAKVTIVKKANEKLGANDPCHCGSGKKFKKCCG